MLTIVDNDAAGAFKFSALSYGASEASPTASVTVTRSGGSASNGKVRIRTVAGGTAVPGTDYEALDQVLDFAANQTSRIVAVTLLTGLNLTVDGARTIKLALDQAEPPGLASVASPSLATITIGDNDVGGTIQFSPTSISVLETAGNAVLTVTRTGGGASGVGATWEITSVGNAAHSTDFTGPLTGSVSFDTGPSQSITIPLIDRPGAHGTRTIQVELTAPTGGAKLGASTATVSILDEMGRLPVRHGDICGQRGQREPHSYRAADRPEPAGGTGHRRHGEPAGFRRRDRRCRHDYTPATQLLSFIPGQTSKTFTVPLKNNTAVDGALADQSRAFGSDRGRAWRTAPGDHHGGRQ